jgi:hypothetical protein
MTKLPTPHSASKIDLFLDTLAAENSNNARLIIALDATQSRQPTWDLATSLTAQMLQAVGGLPLRVQLVYFKGLAECRSSPWVDDARKLTSLMKKVQVEAGPTQIDRILVHARKEDLKQKVGTLVFVGDACEENPDTLAISAGKLGLPAILFQEGDDQAVAKVFRNIADLTHGAYCRFDRGSAKQLAELLGAVAAYAAGGQQALENRSTTAAVKLLQQLRS